MVSDFNSTDDAKVSMFYESQSNKKNDEFEINNLKYVKIPTSSNFKSHSKILRPSFFKPLTNDFQLGDILMIPDPNPIEKYLSEIQHPLHLKHRRYHNSKGISVILSCPISKEAPLKKGVLLLHGHGGHKNYIYMSKLDELLTQLGYHVLRLDFRGLGNSEDCADVKKGRMLYQDLEDIETCYLFLKDIVQVPLDTVIAHSRGVIPMFKFQMLLETKYNEFIPNLVNCAGRYENHELKAKIVRENPSWETDKGFWAKTLRFGKIQDVFIPYEESMSIISVDSNSFANIDKRCKVLSVYGRKDHIVPTTAAKQFEELLEQRHSLIWIDDADHNFYGIVNDDANNPLGLPMKRGKINYNPLVAKKVAEHLATQK
ncbi:hypothetical protein QEN19_002509 [Hanseniaspora menglaensis]